MAHVRIVDVRAKMPGWSAYPPQARTGAILGLAVHHSAIVNPATGLALPGARAIVEAQLNQNGWDHGGYHYVISPNGRVEYALDEAVPAYHAGFIDLGDTLGLEHGQFWNHHYLAVCLLGWFDSGRRVRGEDGQARAVPDFFSRPSQGQWRSLLGVIQMLRERHALPVENVRGHRELAGCRTRCPGGNLDLEELRAALRAA